MQDTYFRSVLAPFVRSTFVLINLIVAAAAAHGATLTVTNTNDSGAGSLRQAIVDAASGDSIEFSLAGCPCTITLSTGGLTIARDLVITGPSASQLTVDAGGSPFVFQVEGGTTATLASMRITGAVQALPPDFSFGSGVVNFGHLTIRECVVAQNQGSNTGGGVKNGGGALTIISSTISGNTAVYTTPSMGGGGVSNASGTVVIFNSTLSGNQGGAAGGGVFNGNGTTWVINSTVSGNSAFRGSAIQHNAGTVNVTNSTIVGNRSAQFEPGIMNNSIMNVSNSIVGDNRQIVGSGFLGNEFNVNTVTGGTVSHTLFTSLGFDPNPSTCYPTVDGVNGNIAGDNGCGVLPIGEVVGGLANNGGPTSTHALAFDSVAVNVGNNSLAVDQGGNPLATDQRGSAFPRIGHGTVDMGAYEYHLDTDGDGVVDALDNCISASNPDQLDTDGDGSGNVCDGDDDNDGVSDGTDNCALTANPDQLDTDGDGAGNACDADDDNDGVNDGADNCPLVSNADQADFDLDGIGDTCDPETGPPTNKEQCKNNNWMRFNFPRTFANQGDCLRFLIFGN